MGRWATGGAARYGASLRHGACVAILAMLAIPIAGCKTMKERDGLKANLRGTGSAVSGAMFIYDYRDGVQVQLSVSNLLPGTYRVALHEQGNCKSPNLASAGPAWAPPGSNKPPGELLPPFLVGDDSMNNYVAYIGGARTEGPLSLRGRAVVIHYGEKISDAFPGQPNNRMACGVLDSTEPLF